jgi:cell division protein ZipA
MDAATLRIVLIVLGAFLLVGLYLWERHRARDEDDDDGWDQRRAAKPHSKREPNLGPFDDDAAEPADAASTGPMASADVDADDSDESWPTSFAAGPDMAFRDEGPNETAGARQASDALIVQLYVVARGEPFSGAEITAAAARHSLVPGDMAIFHRRKVEGAAQAAPFSMANAFNPGTFPFDGMDDFCTPGLVLFAQLDGSPSDLMVFDELVQTAVALAQELDGELLDNARSPLGVEQIKRLRAEVLDLLDGIADPDRE